MIVCDICGREIEDVRDAYRKIVGWERPGRGAHGKSGSSLVLREEMGELAHAECIVRTRTGLNVEQASLI